MGDGRVEGSSAIGDGGQAAISLTPDVDGTHVCIFESSQLEGSYVGDLCIVNSAAVYIGCMYLFELEFLCFPDIYPGVVLLNNMLSLFLVF